jgi:hypothetical protein
MAKKKKNTTPLKPPPIAPSRRSSAIVLPEAFDMAKETPAPDRAAPDDPGH